MKDVIIKTRYKVQLLQRNETLQKSNKKSTCSVRNYHKPSYYFPSLYVFIALLNLQYFR